MGRLCNGFEGILTWKLAQIPDDDPDCILDGLKNSFKVAAVRTHF